MTTTAVTPTMYIRGIGDAKEKSRGVQEFCQNSAVQPCVVLTTGYTLFAQSIIALVKARPIPYHNLAP
jgi:hypothetical protein